MVDKTQGTTHDNTGWFDCVYGETSVESPLLTGSTITGSEATLASATITALTLGVGSLGGMAQVISGSTAAANATVSATHGLGVAPSWVGLTSEGTTGGLQLMSRGTSLIHIQANIGTVGYRALLIK